MKPTTSKPITRVPYPPADVRQSKDEQKQVQETKEVAGRHKNVGPKDHKGSRSK